MRLRRAVPAGLVDAGLASLATFAMGIAAARLFEPALLGTYALFFAAFTTAIVMPRQLVFVPLEIHSLGSPAAERLGVLRSSLTAGVATGIVPALVAPAIAAATTTAGDSDAILGLMVTTGLSAVISPAQDHVRRMFHLAGHSWRAAAASAVQFAGIVAALAVLTEVEVPIAWIPFGGLVLANVISLTAALAMSRGTVRRPLAGANRVRHFARQGSWLTMVGLLPEITRFLVAGVVAHVAGSAVLGLAEAARIVSRPVVVTSRGLSAAIRPRSMESAVNADLVGANKANRVFAGVVLAVGVGYALIAGLDWPGNIMKSFVPVAFDVRWLVLMSIAAVTIEFISLPWRFELMACRAEAKLANVEAIGNTARLAVAGMANPWGAFVVPLGNIFLGGARLSLYRALRRRIFYRLDDGTPSR